MVNVIVLEGDQVVGASEVHAPIVVARASSVGRPAASSVDVAVGDGDAAGGVVTKDDVLATNTGDGDVVNPDEIGPVEGDSIATPNIGRVCSCQSLNMGLSGVIDVLSSVI
jgi:hypothetical protein